MWNADEIKLLGAWRELAAGAAMRLDVGDMRLDILRQTRGWHVLLLLDGVTFSPQRLHKAGQDFPDYDLLLLREQCYLHRRYNEMSEQILRDIYSLVERVKAWPC